MSAPPRPTAVIFDLDGVITLTDSLHFAAWKKVFDDFLESRAEAGEDGRSFRPFTEEDYHAHVDGRPRHDGIRTFLASRNIELPEGDPDDPPDRETIRGLGNRKNAVFNERLAREGVEVAPGAVRLMRDLERSGVSLGLASSSKNARRILEVAGLDALFDGVVDGIVSEDLDLRGKPAPDIFVECLARLGGSDPTTAVVVEDAVAGVEAGQAGGFGLVLAIDRGNDAIQLRERGADWVVEGLDGITVEDLRSWFENLSHRLPNALARWPEPVRDLAGAAPALFLDYDGTLTPIVDRPEQAELSDEMRTTLRRLSSTWPTAVVSGRALEDVRALVDLDRINFAASHGFDLSGPDVDDDLRPEVAEDTVPAVAVAANRILDRLENVDGVIVEDKKFSVAVHYRLVDQGRIEEVEGAVDEAGAADPRLEKTLGKKVFELRPAVNWDKGRAVLWLFEALGLEDEACPIYIGDDVTDEDAFQALSDRGVGILVSALPRPSGARYSLQDVREVKEFLDRVANLRRSEFDRPDGSAVDGSAVVPNPSQPRTLEDKPEEIR